MNKLKQQAQMLKAAFEEGWEFGNTSPEGKTHEGQSMSEDWLGSTTKRLHDQLLMEAQGGTNVQS